MMRHPSSKDAAMRTTVTIEDELLEQALALADPAMPRAAIFREALHAFIRQQSAHRLADLGATAPDMADVPRRQAQRRGSDAPGSEARPAS
jgi:hypothetical protein